MVPLAMEEVSDIKTESLAQMGVLAPTTAVGLGKMVNVLVVSPGAQPLSG
jgi:hypothetical protein